MITPKSELNPIYKLVTRWLFSTHRKDIGTFFLEKLKLMRMNIFFKSIVVIFWFLRWQIYLTWILLLFFLIVRILYFWDLWFHSSIEYTPQFRFGASKCYCDALPGRWGNNSNNSGDEYIPLDVVEQVANIVPTQPVTMEQHLNYPVDMWRQTAMNEGNPVGLYDSRRPQLNWLTDFIRPVLVEIAPNHFDYPPAGHDFESERVFINVEGRTSIVDLGNLRAWHDELNREVTFSDNQLIAQYRQDMQSMRPVDDGNWLTEVVNQPPADTGPSLTELRRSYYRDNS